MQLPVVRAHMSNSSEGTTAALCVDGNTATSCKSARPTSFPWIAIQLGMESTNVPAYLSRVLYWGYVYAANTIGPGQIPAKWSPEYKGMIKIDHPGASTHFGKKKIRQEVGRRPWRKKSAKEYLMDFLKQYTAR